MMMFGDKIPGYSYFGISLIELIGMVVGGGGGSTSRTTGGGAALVDIVDYEHLRQVSERWEGWRPMRGDGRRRAGADGVLGVFGCLGLLLSCHLYAFFHHHQHYHRHYRRSLRAGQGSSRPRQLDLLGASIREEEQAAHSLSITGLPRSPPSVWLRQGGMLEMLIRLSNISQEEFEIPKEYIMTVFSHVPSSPAPISSLLISLLRSSWFPLSLPPSNFPHLILLTAPACVASTYIVSLVHSCDLLASDSRSRHGLYDSRESCFRPQHSGPTHPNLLAPVQPVRDPSAVMLHSPTVCVTDQEQSIGLNIGHVKWLLKRYPCIVHDMVGEQS
eukprot:729046-Hanusia_phi.AAC.7